MQNARADEAARYCVLIIFDNCSRSSALS
jgi:hypothetical protein